ncbi:MAG TPA: translation elongation factor Ts [Anaerolineales bacterium]|nr:translation elongation factor Ts [Anaerolineales bacterium]
MEVTTQMIKELREATQAPMLDCRNALVKAEGDFEKAVDLLREQGKAKAAKREDRDASNGTIEVYAHGGGRVSVIVEVNCETDFVARSEGFRKFAHTIALQIAAGEPKYVTEDQIPQAVLDREAEVARNTAREQGKAEAMLEKIVEGRLKKFKDEVCLMNQFLFSDESVTIQQLMNEANISTGERIVIRRFHRWELGEAL